MKKDIKEHWNDISSNYQQAREINLEDVQYGPKAPTEETLNFLGDVDGKDILEMGCGGGEISIALAKKGANCIGVDISEEQLKIARDRAEKESVEVKFKKDDIENLEMIDSRSKDLVISVFAFDWAQNIDLVFEEAYRVLREKGILVFSMQHPFYNCFSEPDDEFKLVRPYYERENEEEGIKYKLPTVGDLVNGLTEAGFEIKRLLEPEPVDEPQFKDEDSYYPLERLEMIPATIIFKVVKKNQ